MRLPEGETATVVVDEYYVTGARPGAGKPYLPEIDPTLLEFTGQVHHLTPPEIIRLELPGGDTAVFHEQDALLLKGPTTS